jgi:hypothetical protein
MGSRRVHPHGPHEEQEVAQDCPEDLAPTKSRWPCYLESRVGLPSVVCTRCISGKRPIQRGACASSSVQHCKKNALLQTFGLRQPQNGFDYITHKPFQSNSNAYSGVIKLWLWIEVSVGIQNICKMSLAEQQLALSSSCGCCRRIIFYSNYSQQEKERT